MTKTMSINVWCHALRCYFPFYPCLIMGGCSIWCLAREV